MAEGAPYDIMLGSMKNDSVLKMCPNMAIYNMFKGVKNLNTLKLDGLFTHNIFMQVRHAETIGSKDTYAYYKVQDTDAEYYIRFDPNQHPLGEKFVLSSAQVVPDPRVNTRYTGNARPSQVNAVVEDPIKTFLTGHPELHLNYVQGMTIESINRQLIANSNSINVPQVVADSTGNINVTYGSEEAGKAWLAYKVGAPEGSTVNIKETGANGWNYHVFSLSLNTESRSNGENLKVLYLAQDGA